MAWPARNYAQMQVRGVNRDTFMLEKVPGSPTYSFDGKRGSCSSEFYIKWDGNNVNLPRARKDFIGYSEEIAAAQKLGNKWYIHRFIPYEHPNEPNYLFADSIQKITGDIPARYGPSRDVNEVVEYDEALCNVVFTSRDYEILTDAELMAATGGTFPDESKLLRYTKTKIDPAGRAERIPSGAALKWIGNPQLVGGGAVSMTNVGHFNIVEFDVQITWYQIPLAMVPFGSIQEAANKTNEADLGQRAQSNYVVFPAKTLIFIGAKISEPYRMVNGLLAVDIQYAFRWKTLGANSFMRYDATTDITGAVVPQGPHYQLVSRTGTSNGAPLYETFKMDRLFWGPNQPTTLG